MCLAACGHRHHYYRDVSGSAGHKTQVNNNSELLFASRKPEREQHSAHEIRPIFFFETMTIMSVRFRLISCPQVLRSDRSHLQERQGLLQLSPARPATPSRTQIGSTYVSNSTCYALCSRRQDPLACDVQVQCTLTWAVVRTIARMRDVLRRTKFEIIPSSFSLRARTQNDPWSREGSG